MGWWSSDHQPTVLLAVMKYKERPETERQSVEVPVTMLKVSLLYLSSWPRFSHYIASNKHFSATQAW
jgi:hypothetical protein